MKFVVGNGQVIKGWDEGLLDMCVGEKRKLTIQPALGYGPRAMGPIPANSVLGESCSRLYKSCRADSDTLVFETEMVSINGAGKSEL